MQKQFAILIVIILVIVMFMVLRDRATQPAATGPGVALLPNGEIDPNVAQQSTEKIDLVQPISGYTFYQGMDSNSSNVASYPEYTDDALTLATKCNETPTCLGFNTNGWLKNIIYPKDAWSRWSENPKQGFFLKNL